MTLRYEPIEEPKIDPLQEIAAALEAETAHYGDRVDALIKHNLVLSHSQASKTVYVLQETYQQLAAYQHGQFDWLMCRFLGIADPKHLVIDQVPTEKIY